MTTAMSRAVRLPLSVVLVAAGWVVESAAPADAQEGQNPYTSPLDVRAGRATFVRRCTSCHGLKAKGADEGDGPDLTTGQFRHASTDAGLFRVIREGVDGTSMQGLRRRADQSIWQLVTYLRSLHVAPENFDLPGSSAEGQELFAGKGECARCHIVDGRGGRLGPDLSRVGERRKPDELQADLATPNATVSPRWWTLRVTRTDGSVVEGLRMGEDTFSLRLMDAQENLWSFSKAEVRSYERIKDSTMPGYAQSLTPQEVDDLVAYLFSLRRTR